VRPQAGVSPLHPILSLVAIATVAPSYLFIALRLVMPSPFPGMDPYLEQPMFWSEFHNRLIMAISDTLAPVLRPKYYIAVETRTYMDDEDEELLIGIPDALVLSATTR
jgi:hypothetical protein